MNTVIKKGLLGFLAFITGCVLRPVDRLSVTYPTHISGAVDFQHLSEVQGTVSSVSDLRMTQNQTLMMRATIHLRIARGAIPTKPDVSWLDIHFFPGDLPDSAVEKGALLHARFTSEGMFVDLVGLPIKQNRYQIIGN